MPWTTFDLLRAIPHSIDDAPPQRLYIDRMLGASLALLAAVVYGAGDFVGGLAARRVSVLFVVGVGQIAGLVALLLLAQWLSAAAAVSPADWLWGAASGVSTAVGITLLYQALATGRMSVAAPVTALAALALPVLFAFANGEWPGWAPTIGIGLAAIAVALISREDDRTDPVSASTRQVLGLSIAAGLAIGVFYVTMKQTGDGSGLWPLVSARAMSVTIFAVAAVALIQRWQASPVPVATLWGWASLSGLFDSLANALYLLSSRAAPLAIVATLTSLYPASTVLLARVLLHERLRPVQSAGLALAAVAIMLIVARP